MQTHSMGEKSSDILLDTIVSPVNSTQDLDVNGMVNKPPAGGEIFLYLSIESSQPSYTKINTTGIPIVSGNFKFTIPSIHFHTETDYKLLASYKIDATDAMKDPFGFIAKFETA